jgi:hypothetical protein
MQKVLDFLERHVQWVAIAIGALFLFFALSHYLPGIATPVYAELTPGEVLGPGEVDQKIRNEADILQAKIDAQGTVKIPVPDYLKGYRETVAKAVPTSKLPALLVAAQPVEYPPTDFNPKTDSQNPANLKVAELPKLPPVIFETPPTTDFAQITLPPIPGQPIAVAGAPAAALTPGAPAAAPGAVDTTWVRVPFTVPAGNIAKAFQNVNIPANLTLTSFLRVELIRQKQLPGNAWGPEEIVDILPNIAMPKMPEEGPQNLQAQQQYNGWANQNQTAIVQPDFFAVIAGADPRFTKPVAAAAAVPGAPGTFDPETFPPAGAPGSDMSGLTPEQREAVMKVRQRKAKEAAEARPQGGTGGIPSGRGGRGGGGGGGKGPSGGGGGGYSAPPASGLLPSGPPAGIVPFLQARPGNAGPPGMPAGGVPDPTYGPAEGSVTGMPGMPGMPAVGQPTQIPFTPAPNPGPWQPSAVPNGIIEGWAYDVTAAADSTYRYRVRYKLKNPIFGVQNVASNPALVGVFALTGEDPNGWTDPITIAPLTHIYLSALPQAGTGTTSRVALTVFRWQAGKRHRLTNYFVNPGDTIGKEDDGIDYRTHWTLVESRRDSSSTNAYALLMNADGVLKKLDYDADRATPLFAQLNAEVDGPPVAPPTAPGGYPGGYPGGGYPGGNPGGRGPDGGVMP